MSRAGEVLGNYRLIEQRGAGGMGVVWEAEEANGRHVALKQMHIHLCDDADLVARFQREFEVGRALSHPNLVRMVDYNGQVEPPYLVMELATGKSLRRLLERGGRFYEWEAAVVGAQLADALVALQRQRVVHRDLKSSNVVVDRDLRLTIIDYGIAKMDGPGALAMTQGFMGSAEYASPEAYWSRPTDERSDVYAAGVILFEMLTGEVPFRSDRYTDTLRMHAEMPVPDVLAKNAMVSPEMAALVTSILQKQPERRPTAVQVGATCRQIAANLGHVVIRPDVAAGPPPPVPELPRPDRRRSALEPSQERRGDADLRPQAALLAVVGALGLALVIAMVIVAANA